MNDKVKKVIDELRPAIQMDGGDIELIEITEDGIVKVQLQGACAHCPMSKITLKNYVEAKIKNEIPEVKEVVGI